MTIQPRVYFDSLRLVNDTLEYRIEKFKIFPCVHIGPLLKTRYDISKVVDQLIDMEDALGITRDDWMCLDGKFFFTNDSMACLFKLTITTDF